MATLAQFMFTEGELTNFANHVKDLIAREMYNDRKLNSIEDLAANYVVVVTQPGWLGKVFAKFRGENLNDTGNLSLTVLKTINSRKEDQNNEMDVSKKSPELLEENTN